MNKLAQAIPGLQDAFKSNPAPQFKNLGNFLSGIINIALFAAVFLAFYFLIWGAFQYIMAQGQKEGLAKARARITWALIGLLVIFMSYFIAKFAGEVLKPVRGGLPF